MEYEALLKQEGLGEKEKTKIQLLLKELLKTEEKVKKEKEKMKKVLKPKKIEEALIKGYDLKTLMQKQLTRKLQKESLLVKEQQEKREKVLKGIFDFYCR
mmetsp:Transcript_26755/g.20041  ORF Transcript_26755/g.20041 Transcript_26755/m.20041 type:complete len:100 (+) Transcript_26755:115-414(+)